MGDTNGNNTTNSDEDYNYYYEWDKYEVHAQKYYIVLSVLTGACAACVAAAAAAWWLAPRWRTLHNFISLNQIANGTLWIFGNYMLFAEYLNMCHCLEDADIYNLILYIMQLSRLSMSCWSLFATVYAYIKLVLLHRHRISCEKRLAFVITYGVVFVIRMSTYLATVLRNENKEYHLGQYFLNAEIFLLDFLPTVISALVLVLFIRICVSVMCCRGAAASSRSRQHVMSLVGVAVMCDTFDLAYVATYCYLEYYQDWPWYSDNYIYTIFGISMSLRVILQTIFVFFKKSSRVHFKFYSRRMRNRFTNDFQLT